MNKDPTLDLKGDLADRINRNIIAEHNRIHSRTPTKDRPPIEKLTRKEEVACCTYAQWLPNLDSLAGSIRLKDLMELDLINRDKSRRPNPGNKDNKTQKPTQAVDKGGKPAKADKKRK